MEAITAAAFAQPAIRLATKLFKPLIDKLEAEATGQAKVFYHRIFGSYTSYLSSTFDRHSFFTSIVFKNQQKKLLDYYIPLSLQSSNDKSPILMDTYPCDLISKVSRLLIVDTAGMGKTTLLKYLFINCINQEAGIPVFIELRKLSRKLSIIEYLAGQISDLRGKFDEDLLIRLLESGEFTIFLDGYDEIPDVEREHVTGAIQSFLEKAPKNKYIMTSREEEGLAAFNSFFRYSICPLQKSEAYSLLKKYAEEPLASALIEKLELPEYKSIHEFLTNPLLTSLLFKSYEYKRTIPLKSHIFYRQVYESLFECHDLTKEGGEFHRSKKSGLDIDRFEQVLRVYGAMTYKLGTELGRDKTLECIGKALSLASEKKVTQSKFLHDLTHAVPLMVEDGSYVRWSHRSIQEYYAALYICWNSQSKKQDVLLHFFNGSDATKHINLISLCADIDRSSFELTIGREIARLLLNEYDHLFETLPPGISSSQIERRKSLIAGKCFYLITDGGQQSKAEDLNSFHKRINECFEIMKGEYKINDGTSCVIFGGLPGIGRISKPKESFIFQIQDRVNLPFLTRCPYFVPSSFELPTASEKAVKIDDSIDNCVNSPELFDKVNEILESQVRWSFNKNAALEYLSSTEEHKIATQEFEPW